MALPPYVAKAISSVLGLVAGFKSQQIAQRLNDSTIVVAFDGVAAASSEGRQTLQFVTDLLARLYPVLGFVNLEDTETAKGLSQELVALAQGINPNLSVFAGDRGAVSYTLVVGATQVTPRESDSPVLYLGSDRWIALCSKSSPVSCGDSPVPFGAVGAACIGAANVFRAVFSDLLRTATADSDLALSLFDSSMTTIADAESLRNPEFPPDLDMQEVFLVGVGAIGHACAYCLARLSRLRGTLNLVDDEEYDDSNPQRYCGTKADAADYKVDSVATWFTNHSADFRVLPHAMTWDRFVSGRGSFQCERVAVALDSAEDRMFVQATLPKWIANSWTQEDNVGVSRHHFLTSACLACIYLPTSPAKSLDEEVADALRFPLEQLRFVRELLDTGRFLDADLIRQIEKQVAIADGALAEFTGKPLITLYQRAACGGLILDLGGVIGVTPERAQVPLAFQSAFAGTLLAAEIVATVANLRDAGFPVRTEFNLLRALSGTPLSPEGKSPSGRCICQDADYIAAFNAKYAS